MSARGPHGFHDVNEFRRSRRCRWASRPRDWVTAKRPLRTIRMKRCNNRPPSGLSRGACRGPVAHRGGRVLREWRGPATATTRQASAPGSATPTIPTVTPPRPPNPGPISRAEPVSGRAVQRDGLPAIDQRLTELAVAAVPQAERVGGLGLTGQVAGRPALVSALLRVVQRLVRATPLVGHEAGHVVRVGLTAGGRRAPRRGAVPGSAGGGPRRTAAAGHGPAEFAVGPSLLGPVAQPPRGGNGDALGDNLILPVACQIRNLLRDHANCQACASKPAATTSTGCSRANQSRACATVTSPSGASGIGAVTAAASRCGYSSASAHRVVNT